MFSEELRNDIEMGFNKIIQLVHYKKEKILEGLNRCSIEEQDCIKFLYTCMPLSDIANYDFEIYLGYVKHSLYLREKVPWVKEMPMDIFLNYIMFYRINNENIEDCRKFFYDCIINRIRNKNIEEAIIEVNYWCLEQATYRTTDQRTASPLTVLRSAYGRCGEESVFTVTALRSVGIPARQVYVPRWSHCDDNHAWVEVWCNGKWNYLGACEPEPSLNIGWFTIAASRAMMINCRILTPTYRDKIMTEEIISKNDKVTLINCLNTYTDTKKIKVKVIDDSYSPVEQVEIRFEVLNYSELFPVATVKTDKKGIVQITLGLGDIYIHGIKDNKYVNRLLDTRKDDSLVLRWNEFTNDEPRNEEIDIHPPNDNTKYAIKLSKNQKEYGEKCFCNSEAIRKIKENKYDNNHKLFLENNYPNTLKDFFVKARGNYEEIRKFISTDINGCNMKDKIRLLSSLSDKDYTDITYDILEENLIYSNLYKNYYEEKIFTKYIMNPRVYFEMITNYRKFFLNYFDEETKNKFLKCPASIWGYIDANIKEMDALEYKTLITNPVELIKVKKGSNISKKILFVAICRSLGIPARINKENMKIQYYIHEKFINVRYTQQKERVKLTIINEDNTNWTYWTNWTIGMLHNGVYETLDYMERKWINNRLVLELEYGQYRIITSNRMPTGSVLVKTYCFDLLEDKQIGIILRKGKIKDLYKNIEIDDFQLQDNTNNIVKAKDVIGNTINMVLWIEEGKEPTEHVLNEMLDNIDLLNRLSCNITFILKSKEVSYNTLNKILEQYNHVKVYYDTGYYNVEPISRRVYVDPDKLPLILVTNNGLNVLYAFSGYNVGVIELIIKIIKSI